MCAMSQAQWARMTPSQQQQYRAAYDAQLQKSKSDESSLNDPVQGFIKSRTHLIQCYSSDPQAGSRMISERNDKGVPIMV